MTWSVRKAVVAEYSEQDTFLVALAEHDDGGGRNLMFSIPTGDAALDELDEDEELYTVFDEENRVVSGGVIEWLIEGNILRLSLTPKAADTVGLEVDAVLELEISASEIEEVRGGLNRVFAGQPG